MGLELYSAGAVCSAGKRLRSVPQDPSARLREGLPRCVTLKCESGAILLKATDSLTFQTSREAAY